VATSALVVGSWPELPAAVGKQDGASSHQLLLLQQQAG